MSLSITAAVERWPVAGQFIIARGAKTHVDVLVVAVSDGVHVGMGEGTAIYYHGESAESCLAQIETVIGALGGLTVQAARDAAQTALPPGAARNALDCALWDLEAKAAAGLPLWQLVGLSEAPVPLQTAFTISLGEPAIMEADAAKAAARGFGLLKLKLTGEGDRERVAAVRKAAPDGRLIVDANESWRAGHCGRGNGAGCAGRGNDRTASACRAGRAIGRREVTCAVPRRRKLPIRRRYRNVRAVL